MGATWITQIRQMEITGQTMGLDETLNGLNAVEENGIDVHMMLPREYGAVAILSASGYGNSGKLLDEADIQKRTTTGNATGVYFTGDRWEIVAGTSVIGISKYQEGFTFGCAPLGWHGSPTSQLGDGTYNYGLNVATVGGQGLFSRYMVMGNNSPNPWGHFNSNRDRLYCSRGICVLI